MGIASLVLGIVSVIIGFIPFCGIIALVPAIVGVILGILDFSQSKKEDKPKEKSLAGMICSIVAIVIIVAYYLIAGVAAKKIVDKANEIDWNSYDSDSSYDYDYDYDL